MTRPSHCPNSPADRLAYPHRLEFASEAERDVIRSPIRMKDRAFGDLDVQRGHVDRRYQRLHGRLERPALAADAGAVPADHSGQVVQGRTRQRQPSTIEKHAKPLVWAGGCGRSPVLPGASLRPRPATPTAIML